MNAANDGGYGPLLIISIPLQEGIEMAAFEMIERAIDAYMEERGFSNVGSGTGFGKRDLEYDLGPHIADDAMLNQIVVDVMRQTGRPVSVHIV